MIPLHHWRLAWQFFQAAHILYLTLTVTVTVRVAAALQEALASCDEPITTRLASFAASEHARRMASPGVTQHTTPTAVLTGGGVNVADHTQTFSRLREHLCAQVLLC